jgi:hypothetical protein
MYIQWLTSNANSNGSKYKVNETDFDRTMRLNEEHSAGTHEDVVDCLGCIENHYESRLTQGDYSEIMKMWLHGGQSDCRYQDCIDERTKI